MDWHQSYMFSSTAQILEVYLEPSPIPSENGSTVMRWSPKDEIMLREKIAENKNANFLQSSATTPSIPSTNSSPASSPASSHTTYSSDGSSTKKSVSSEIRRRRLPEGAEPRVKNLTLKKSNGATRLAPPPPIVDAALTASSSNYSRSPTMDSPTHVAPALPPKAAARSLRRKPVNQNSIQREQALQMSPSNLPEVDILGLPRNMPIEQPQEKAQKLSDTTESKAREHPPRSTSMTESQASVVGRRPVPAHKKTLSTASSNKDLPPDPPIDRSLLPQSKYTKNRSASSSTVGETPSSKRPVHSRGQSDPTTQQRERPVAIGLPAGPKAAAAVPRRPIPVKEDAKPQSSESVQQVPARGGPKLGSLSSGPKPASKTANQTDNSLSTPLSTLTSATVSGPVPLPDFQAHSRSNSEVNTSSLRTRSREGSRARAESEEMITIAIDVRPTQPPHRPTLSQTSTRSEPSQMSRSTTPLSQRSTSTAPTSISSLPNVPEVRTPLIAPEIKPSHFGCYTQHRPLVASSNHQTPILCMTCKQDSEKMWACGWCHLRICTGCKDALVEVKNDLKKMLDEANTGTLIIGKERIPMPPFLGGNAWRSQGSDTSSVRSNNSAGSRPMHHRGPPPPRQGPYLRQERSMDNLPSYGGSRGPYGPPRHNRGPPPQQMRGQQFGYMGIPPMNNRPRQPMPVPGQPRSKPSTAPQSPNMSTPTFGPVSLGFQANTPNSNDNNTSIDKNNDNNQSNPYANIPSNSIPYPHGRNPYHHQYQTQGQSQRPIDRGPPPPAPPAAGSGPINHYRPAPDPVFRNPPPRPPRSDEDEIITPLLDLSLDAGAGPMAAGLRGLRLGGTSGVMSRPVMMGVGNGPYPSAPQVSQPRMRGMA